MQKEGFRPKKKKKVTTVLFFKRLVLPVMAENVKLSKWICFKANLIFTINHVFKLTVLDLLRQ